MVCEHIRVLPIADILLCLSQNKSEWMHVLHICTPTYYKDNDSFITFNVQLKTPNASRENSEW